MSAFSLGLSIFLFLNIISRRFTQRSATPSNKIIFIIVKYGQGFGILFRSAKFLEQPTNVVFLLLNQCSVTRSSKNDRF